MVVIRLARGGANKRPYFHIVAADRRCSRDGRFLQLLGRFNPIASGQEQRLVIDVAKIQAWLDKGAQMSHRVTVLFKEACQKTG